MVTYTLKCEEASGDQPPKVVLAGFPNGTPNKSFFEEGSDDRLAFEIYANSESRKSKQVCAAACWRSGAVSPVQVERVWGLSGPTSC